LQGTFYLGANTPKGFFSYYDELNASAPSHKYIIKGGPGTGKSTFMRKFAEAALKKGEKVEHIVCSSDPSSLDGVILIDRGTSFSDGTSPHVTEPVCPGAYDEIINLGEYWRKDILKEKRAEIEKLFSDISASFKSAYRYLAAAGFAHNEMHALIADHIEHERLSRLALRIAKAEFGTKSAASQGKEHKRFISGITPVGINHYLNENLASFEKVYNIYDPFCIAGDFLTILRDNALRAGHDVISCFCPMNPDASPEHIIIEDMGLAFVTSNAYHKFEGDSIRKINLERYVSEDAKRKNRQKLKFSIKLKSSLIGCAVENLRQAKSLHDELEAHYISAMDFRKLDSMKSKLLTKIMV